ncbi:hypothetical protein BN7_813a [Wickerhamomyces ciferrii]|uniref:Uncharacterized protein n=1 Tax=Wickerhamomyces ciferrii (strain ATCC 14091 / BCRC 22168 / CBS 111 / JCM 3599 / NBRC 0793 / NRRL Y-1031 F-60-10) TaxID=1206466 RepID=K0KEF4_WICCF|nr:uncharacterized protein BN7_813a [Wickerhamomyces ciferrii]CCH41276.1 hypothetical protein BN7_813a [Wickerhamomyces ciferrii]
MPVRNGVLESYLNPLLTILHEIPSFRKAIYEQQFDTLGFHPRWYRGEPIKIPEGAATKVKEGHEVDLKLLLEVQRLFAFLDGDSLRSFSSILNFLKAFPKEAQKEFHNVESIYEAYEVFYKVLIKQLEAVGADDVHQFFESKLYYDETEKEKSFGMFHVEAEELKSDLYKTIHTILWGEDFESTERILTSVSDVVTISFEPSFHHAPFGIEIPEVFYPQIYTKDFQETINTLVKEKESTERERREISKELMKLRVYQGKNVTALLDTSVEFLSSESESNKDDKELSDALKDLSSIKDSSKDKIGELLAKQDLITESKTSRDPFNINTILKRHGSTPEPYLLTGVIINNTEFLFLKKPQDLIELENPQWVHVIYDPTTCNDLKHQYSNFETIKRSLYGLTRTQFASSIVLIYVKESTWNSKTDYERSESVKQFIQKDIEELGKSLELLVPSSGEESDDNISDSDSDSDVDATHVEHVELELTPEETNDLEGLRYSDSANSDDISKENKENKENLHSNNPFRD